MFQTRPSRCQILDSRPIQNTKNETSTTTYRYINYYIHKIKRNINYYKKQITIAHHVSSSFLLPCPVATSRCPEGAQVAPKASPGVPKRLRRPPLSRKTYENTSEMQNYEFKTTQYRIILLTFTQGPWSEVQGRRSQVRGSGFMVGSAGPRRVCNFHCSIF